MFDQCREESWEYGDSVTYDLEREGDAPIEIELYECGRIITWPVETTCVNGIYEEESEKLFAVDETTHSARIEAFRRAGWLDPPS